MTLENILYVPLDVPKWNVDKTKIFEYFDPRKTLHQGWKWVEIKKFSDPIDKEFNNLFPEFESIVRFLPFEEYDKRLHIDIREQIIEIRPHQDPVTKLFNESCLGPASYKCLIIRECLETFYILPQSLNPDVVQYDKRPKDKLNYIFPKLPDETNWFALNNNTGFHGAFQAPLKYKKLTLFISGKVDEKKHFDLIKRSLSKFPDYAVYN
jgi:hypothetical protein